MRSTLVLELLGLVAVFGAVAQATTIHCTAGEVPDANGNCQPCPAGEYSKKTSFNTNDAPFSCTACAVGTYQDSTGQTSCISCSSGTANPNTGSTSSTDCAACPSGSVAPAESSTCTACGSGTQPNAAGSSCSNCAAGTFNGVSGGTCCECCSGYWSAAGSSSCNACPNTTPYALPGSTKASDCGSTSLAPANPRAYSCSQTGTTCPAVDGPAGSMRRKRADSYTCSRGYKYCPHYSGQGGFDCVDVANDIESCGGCIALDGSSDADNGGQDCTAIPGVNVTKCKRGQCQIKTCRRGFVLSNNGKACTPIFESMHYREQREVFDGSIPAPVVPL